MLDDAPTPPPPLPTSEDQPLARQVCARFLDARARGLAHEMAIREAAGLLWALRPSLSSRQAEEMTADIVAAMAGG